MSKSFLDKQIGDFYVQERIGRGAMSVVYRALQQSVNRAVAFKLIDFGANPLILDNYQPYFIQEAKVIATLEHIHIVPIYNYGSVDAETSFIAMRMLPGSVDVLLERGRLPLSQAADIFTQAAQGLAHAHEQGILHRDLKPSNILLDSVGNAYLSDFGLGKLAEVSLDLTASGNTIGTPLYASPEQIVGDEIMRQSDIYSMGAIFYHMLTGQPPYAFEGNLLDFIRQHDQETPLPPSALQPLIPPEIDALVLQALRRDPKERPESIGGMAETLNRALGRRTSSSDAVIYVPPVRSSHRKILTGVALIAILLVVLLALAVLSTPRGPRVMAGARGTLADTAVSDSDIEVARTALGTDGFIAFIACSLESEFQASRARIMADLANQYGLPFQVYDSELDSYRQITRIERARLDGARGIILCSLDSRALDTTLRSVQEAGIPLVFFGQNSSNYGGVVIDLANREMGLRIGHYAGQIIQDEMGGQAQVILLAFPTMSTSQERAEGLEAGLHEIAPQAAIIARLPGGAVDEARESIQDLLESQTPFDVILSSNDAGAYGAVQALEAADVSPDDVFIVSINGEENALQMIQDGRYLRATLDVDREGSSSAALNAMVHLLAGAQIPEVISIPPGELHTRETEGEIP